MILCDTGPLVAAFNTADRDHGRCAQFLRENWCRLVIASSTSGAHHDADDFGPGYAGIRCGSLPRCMCA